MWNLSPPGMAWGPPSEFALFYFVFSFRLVFSSAFRPFSRHLVCASKREWSVLCNSRRARSNKRRGYKLTVSVASSKRKSEKAHISRYLWRQCGELIRYSIYLYLSIYRRERVPKVFVVRIHTAVSRVINSWIESFLQMYGFLWPASKISDFGDFFASHGLSALL